MIKDLTQVHTTSKADSAQARTSTNVEVFDHNLTELLGPDPLPTIGTNLAVALDLAKRFAVFPCREYGPKGVIKSPYTANGHSDASTDPDQIRRWWQRWPDALPALPTGERSGLSVLDLDRHGANEDGIAALRGLGFDPDTLSPFSVTSGSGGQHIYLQHSPGITNADSHLPAGINVRGQGGYVIAPRAMLPDGRRYQARGTLDLTKLPPWPAALLPPAKPERDPNDLTDLLGDDPLPIDWPEVKRAIEHIDPNCSRDEWVKVGMALHAASGGSQEAFELWDRWSAGASEPGKYNARIMRGQWHSFGKRDGIDIGTLFHIAGECGWTPGFKVDIDDFDDLIGETKPDALFESASAWAAAPAKAREWLVEDLIPNGVVTMLNGDGGTGKSLLALQLAVATASDRPWLGRAVDRPGKAIVLSAEDSKEELHRRLEDFCGDALAKLDRLLIRSFVDADPLLATFDKQNTIKMTKLFSQLESTMDREWPSLVVLDTLADLHTGDENNRSHARQFIGKLKALAGRFNCAVLLLAHPSRSGMADGSGASGSTGWNNSVRSRLYLQRVIDKDGREWDDKARVLSTVKANYGARGGTIDLRWQHGSFVAAGDPFDDLESRTAKAERVFLKLLDRFAAEGSHVSRHHSSTFAPKLFSEQPDNESCSKNDLEGAMNRLFLSGRIHNGTHKSNRQERTHIEKVEPGAFVDDDGGWLV
ncbi:AAA family ATPase [Mesorhizobium sp.]|uniref:AAA family ATPase n=1 Tax=Mesorhizobium sp. TaxID=1871066 RepID=UPI00257F504A|nr:AAA family ATPase [Mesorhizobium sp.]